MTLVASGALEAGARIQYLHTLVCGEVLCQFELLSPDVEITKTLIVDDIIRGLAQ